MKIFVQEFASGGGLGKEPLNDKLLVEGFGMLRVLTQNFKRLNFEVITTIDERLLSLSKFLEADRIKTIAKNQSMIAESLEPLEKCDYFLVVAPGSEGTLSSIVMAYQKTAAESLNCSPEAIDFMTDKSKVYDLCSKNLLLYPKTLSINPEDSFQDAPMANITIDQSWKHLIEGSGLSYPLIIKPNDGVACEGLFLCNSYENLAEKILSIIEPKDYSRNNQGSNQKEKKHLESSDSGKRDKKLLVQEFIAGEDLSVTAVVRKGIIKILSINKQIVSLGESSSEYLGGISNITHPMAKEIVRICKTVLMKIGGLNGFVGLDLISNREKKGRKGEVFLLEINPRATTSICGLIKPNNRPITELFPRDALEGYKKQSRGKFDVCYFSKVRLELTKEACQRLYRDSIEDPTIVTPPLNFGKRKNYVALVRGSGRNTEEARKAFEKNYRNLNRLKSLK